MQIMCLLQKALAEKTNADLYQSFYEDYSKPDIETREATIKYNHVHDGDLFNIGSVTIKAIHTPGHTAGSISFLIENDNSDNEILLIWIYIIYYLQETRYLSME